MLKSPGLLIEEKLVSAVSECSSNNNIIVGLLRRKVHENVIPPQTPLQ